MFNQEIYQPLIDIYICIEFVIVYNVNMNIIYIYIHIDKKNTYCNYIYIYVHMACNSEDRYMGNMWFNHSYPSHSFCNQGYWLYKPHMPWSCIVFCPVGNEHLDYLGAFPWQAACVPVIHSIHIASMGDEVCFFSFGFWPHDLEEGLKNHMIFGTCQPWMNVNPKRPKRLFNWEDTIYVPYCDYLEGTS